MKIRIASKLIIILLLTSLTPLLIASGLSLYNISNIIQLAIDSNQQNAKLAMSDSTEALEQEQNVKLKLQVASLAGDINAILSRVEADTSQLADFATYLYNHPDSVTRYPYPSVYNPDATKKMFGSVEPNQNSWLGVFSSGTDTTGNVPPATLKEIYLTEFLDIKFKSVAEHNPYAVQVYINTKSQITRGMPFINGQYVWVNAIDQFKDSPDVTAFDFYYLADEAHNPKHTTRWTELYWDPAGLGWMVSCVAPAYRANELMGVTGIDITLGKMVDQIINVQIEKTGFAFLMSQNGQAIAFPERAAPFLGFKDSFTGNFGDNEQFSFFLTQANDATFQEIIRKMQSGDYNFTTYKHPKTGQEYFFAYHPVSKTGWSVGIVVPREEVIAPALATNQKITANTQTTVDGISKQSTSQLTTSMLILGGIIILILPLATLFSRTISRPIKALDDGSKRIGQGDLAHRIQVNSGDEIEHLAATFNQMAAELETKVEEIEAANAQLRKLDELKSQFISMASHELRTPLIAIQGYVDLLREHHDTDEAERRQMLDTVSRNATRLARIVTELLDISKIEENKLVLRTEPISVAEVITEIADEQKPSLLNRRHTLVLELQPNLPLITGDRDRIAQVIINLLGNAIKYTPDGGQITIRAAVTGAKLGISVIDNGIGIKPEDISKLFKRFSTVGDVTKHKSGKNEFMAGGTGLGLSIIKGIVEAHGGSVTVESEYGAGSAFNVWLPLPDGADGHTPSIPESAVYRATKIEQPDHPIIKANGKVSILVIDDEEDVLDITQRLLADTYTVFTAKTSATGLKEALSRQPNLILLDVMMPGISGYDVCKTLKRNVKTKNIPVIIFTAAIEKVNEEKARAVGADGFITKPFKKENLISLIENYKETVS